MGELILTLRQVSVKYSTHRDWVLRDINLDIFTGSRTAIVGQNGSGKSTLLRVISGLIPRQSNNVYFEGSVEGLTSREIAYMPQNCKINFQFPVTLHRFVSMGKYANPSLNPSHLGKYDQLADEWMQKLGLKGIENRLMSELSGGQQQRAFLARALVQDARLILFDEPLNALDKETQSLFMNILNEMHSMQKAFVMVTHHADWESITIDHIYKLENCKLYERTPANQDVNAKGCC